MKDGKELHYYSGRLSQKLSRICLAPTTVVEAPSGYGKTTAVRDFMESALRPGTPVFWFTAVEETRESSYRRFLLTLNQIDGGTGQHLLKIGYPNAATIGEICDALRTLRCGRETYLVLDNFQYLQQEVPRAFLSAILERGARRLHVVVITQMLTRDMVAAMAACPVLHIATSDLRLEAEDIRRFYALSGTVLSAEEIRRITRYTEGWVAAVYLQLQAYQDTGTLPEGVPEILLLMEHIVWDKLGEEQQTFLLRLSPLETFTVQDATVLGGGGTLSEDAFEALGSPFIRYDPVGQRYELHSILSDLLIQKRRERGIEFERQCLTGAGDLCRDAGKPAEALNFYWQALDYRRIAALDFSGLIGERIGETPFAAVALALARNCPAEWKQAYPLSMLRSAWALLLSNQAEAYRNLLRELRPTLETGAAPNPLLAEWFLLSALGRSPDLKQMTADLRQAEVLFGGECSRVIRPSSPLYFGTDLLFSEFHRRPGEAEQEAAALERCIAVYSRLTGGHGSGADALFRSSTAFYRMDLSEAEIFAYQAAYQAENSGQSILLLNAAYLLAEIAVQKGDISGWQSAAAAMERASSSGAQNHAALRSLVDIVRGILLCGLQTEEKVAGWLRGGEFTGRQLTPCLRSTAQFVYFASLWYEGKYEAMLGKIQAVLAGDSTPDVTAQVLLLLLTAAGYGKIGRREEARSCVERAAELAVPDGFLLPLVSFSSLTGGLTDQVVAEKYPDLKDRLDALKRKSESGRTALRRHLFSGDSSEELTEREAEVARLAAEGLRNGEIAERLCVSENTVRTHMRMIFQKFGIDRRSKLAEKLREH